MLGDSAILAAAARYSAKSSTIGNHWYLVCAIAGIAVFWVALHYWNRYRDKLVLPGRRLPPLFLELCEAHQLSRAERTLLLKAVESSRLTHAAAVFVDERILRRLIDAGGADGPPCAELLAKLFGSAAEA
jgi:hypothetical protein